jgi:hypothetical protein
VPLRVLLFRVTAKGDAVGTGTEVGDEPGRVAKDSSKLGTEFLTLARMRRPSSHASPVVEGFSYWFVVVRLTVWKPPACVPLVVEVMTSGSPVSLYWLVVTVEGKLLPSKSVPVVAVW